MMSKLNQKFKAIHVHLEGFTAFFRQTFTITGTQISLPCPSYANLLGLISACTDRTISPRDTRIGFEFKHASEDIEIERTDRLVLSGKFLKEQSKGQGILKRQIHFRPQLDLYLTNLELADDFMNPAAPLCLGRSQDLCWITKVEPVELIPAKSGNIGSTLISNRVVKTKFPSYIVRCPEWFNNEVIGRTRKVGAVGYYQAIPPFPNNDNTRINVTMNNLYHPSNLQNPEDVIYLHEWSKPLIRVSKHRKIKR
jgi:CRISPR-associated protein Cas5t